jgi:hypothetical protein
MLFEIVTFHKGGEWNTRKFEAPKDADAEYFKTFHDLDVTGYNNNPSQRAELQGGPKFKGLLGPMYGGPGVLRYENQAAYDSLCE